MQHIPFLQQVLRAQDSAILLHILIKSMNTNVLQKVPRKRTGMISLPWFLEKKKL